jgi:transposase
MRCPECNVFEGWDVNAASNLATRAKHELEGKPAPAYRSQAELKGQRQKK